MTLRELVERTDLVGRDVENEMGYQVTRGPVKRAYLKNEVFVVETEWWAIKLGDGWTQMSDDPGQTGIHQDSADEPFDCGEGVIKIRHSRCYGNSITFRAPGDNLNKDQLL
jgi:hypothetical protein